MTKLSDSIAEGILLPESNFQNNWDGPGRSATKKLEDGWSVEVFPPSRHGTGGRRDKIGPRCVLASVARVFSERCDQS